MTTNRRERVPKPTGCDKCTNKTCLLPGTGYGQPCGLVENWLKSEEKGSSISRENVILCGDEGFMDKLAFEQKPEPEPVSLDYFGIESLDEFAVTDKQREVIKLFFYESKRISQIASELNISSEAVLDRIEHGKSRIEKQLNRKLLFKEYLLGKRLSEIFGDSIKNSFLAKLIIEAYFIECLPAGDIVRFLETFNMTTTTLGVVYKYVGIVKEHLEPIISDKHKKALTNFSY